MCKFLLKQKDVNNSNIPYQINLIELEKIIDNQGKYYPVLLENREKIIKLLTFRIPYYIGPVNPRKNDNKFAWVKKKERF
jgi:CRISPR-associated endonuclease Csn1